MTKCNSRYASGTPIALEKIKERQSIVAIARARGKEGEVFSRWTPSRGLALVSLGREVCAYLLSRSLTLKVTTPAVCNRVADSLQCVSRKKRCSLVLAVVVSFPPDMVVFRQLYSSSWTVDPRQFEAGNV